MNNQTKNLLSDYISLCPTPPQKIQSALNLYNLYETALQIVESDKDNETIQQAMLYLKADISKGLLELSENIIKQHKGENNE